MGAHRPSVYLAGPISGCNEVQRTAWRDEAKRKLGAGFDFIDPIVTTQGQDQSPASVVQRDLDSIRRCDAMLANMWKESIGTAIGVFQAWRAGKVVVLVDPNHIESRIAAFYADAVAYTLGQGIKDLKHLLAGVSAIREVIKSDGKTERFALPKLKKSISRVCWAAGLDDVVYPAQIRPRVMEALIRRGAELDGKIPSAALTEVVFLVLQELERERGDAYGAIRQAWEQGRASRRPPLAASLVARAGDSGRDGGRDRGPAVHDAPQVVPIRSHKSHATIWGTAVKALSDVPGPAQAVFREIQRVSGVRGIRLTRMTQGTSPTSPAVRLVRSKTPGLIEGKLYDRTGVRGNVQCFQVTLSRPGESQQIFADLAAHLRSKGVLLED